MIGKWVSTVRITARTAATRDGASKAATAAAAGAASASAATRAGAVLLLTVAMVLPAGCGSSPRKPGYLDRARLEGGVRRRIEQGLMTSSPREPGAGSPTHVRDVACEPRGERRFRCTAVLATGHRTGWNVRVTADGRGFAVERTETGP